MGVPDEDIAAPLPEGAEGDSDRQVIRRPKTVTVLGLILLTALALSWLGSYALSNVLVNAGLISAWPADHDPRPMRLAVSFGCLMILLLLLAGVVRYSSKRQMERIEGMEEEGP